MSSLNSARLDSQLRIAHINIGGGIQKKLDEILKIAVDNQLDIVGISETFLQDDLNVPGFSWFGKNSVEGKKRKGVGFLVPHKVKAFDIDETWTSQDPRHDVKWIGIDNGTLCMAVAVIYVPAGCQASFRDQLWIDIEKAVVALQTKGFNIVLTGDLNAHINIQSYQMNHERVVTKADTAGGKLVQWSHRNGFAILKKNPLCKGVFTWQKGHLRSAIDYILVDSEVAQVVTWIEVDELGAWEVASDHNWIWCDLCWSIEKVAPPPVMHKWDINESSNWDLYREELDNKIAELDIDRLQEETDKQGSY